MTDEERDNVIWQTAVGWVIREHEEPLDGGARQALVTWLKSDPAHGLAYEEASYLWLLTGLVPSSEEESSDDSSSHE